MLDPEGLRVLIATLAGGCYQVLGPTVRDGAIVYDALTSSADLPAGFSPDSAPRSGK